MADDKYRESKVVRLSGDVVTVSKPTSSRMRQWRHPSSRPWRFGEYTVFKETMTSAVDELKLEIQNQNQQTREAVHASRREILEAVNASPAESLKLLCKFGVVFLLFALTVRFTLRIELVNTAFAIFMLPALAIYWAMAHVQQTSEKRKSKHPPA